MFIFFRGGGVFFKFFYVNLDWNNAAASPTSSIYLNIQKCDKHEYMYVHVYVARR